MSLFVDQSSLNNVSTKSLRSYTADYFIDTSGSTSGSILASEISSATHFSNYFTTGKIVSWNNYARICKYFTNLRSTGGTDPSCFVQHLSFDNLIMVYTDGQI